MWFEPEFNQSKLSSIRATSTKFITDDGNEKQVWNRRSVKLDVTNANGPKSEIALNVGELDRD